MINIQKVIRAQEGKNLTKEASDGDLTALAVDYCANLDTTIANKL
jgi:hypothetical protein